MDPYVEDEELSHFAVNYGRFRQRQAPVRERELQRQQHEALGGGDVKPTMAAPQHGPSSAANGGGGVVWAQPTHLAGHVAFQAAVEAQQASANIFPQTSVAFAAAAHPPPRVQMPPSASGFGGCYPPAGASFGGCAATAAAFAAQPPPLPVCPMPVPASGHGGGVSPYNAFNNVSPRAPSPHNCSASSSPCGGAFGNTSSQAAGCASGGRLFDTLHDRSLGVAEARYLDSFAEPAPQWDPAWPSMPSRSMPPPQPRPVTGAAHNARPSVVLPPSGASPQPPNWQPSLASWGASLHVVDEQSWIDSLHTVHPGHFTEDGEPIRHFANDAQGAAAFDAQQAGHTPGASPQSIHPGKPILGDAESKSRLAASPDIRCGWPRR